MNQSQERTIKDFVLVLTPYALGFVISFQAYLFTTLLDTREEHLKLKHHVAENYVAKQEMRDHLDEIKQTLRDIRTELQNTKSGG